MTAKPSRRGPRAGRGSNQYQTKPGARPFAAVELDAEAVAWAFHPDRTDWENAGVTDAEDVVILQGAGITPHEWTYLWAANKFVRPADAADWKATGLSSLIAGIWRDVGFTAPEAAAWDAARFEVYRAAEWRDAGFDPDAARRWSDVIGHGDRMGDHEFAVAWIRYGMSIDDAAAWKSAGVSSPGLAARWRGLGYAPDRAPRRV